jgi:type IX secretion system PorP/SprF family membrane protein
MKKIYLLIIAIAATFHFNLFAQDAHFAQYYSFGQALNPALTANHDGSYQVALIYRNQWNSFLGKNSFVTPGASVDFSLFEGQLKNDKLGMGFMFFNDRFGQGSLSTLNAAYSLAYHKGLGKSGRHRISLGGQVAYVQRSIDSDSFIFYDQFDANTHRQFGISQDVLDLERGNYFFFDYNFGLYWRSNFSDKVRAQGGFSVFHMSEPTEYFIKETNDYFLPRRYVGDFGMEIFFTEKIAFAPDVIYQMQGEAQQFLTGASFSYYFNSGFRTNSSIHLGARYRFSQINGDAVVPIMQVEFRNLRLGAAYDVNISNLRSSSSLKGAFELSMVYTGESIRSYKANKSLPARRF